MSDRTNANAEFVKEGEYDKIRMTIKGKHVILSVNDCITFKRRRRNGDPELIIAKIHRFGYTESRINRIFYRPWREEGGFWGAPSGSRYIGEGDWTTITKMDRCPDETTSSSNQKPRTWKSKLHNFFIGKNSATRKRKLGRVLNMFKPLGYNRGRTYHEAFLGSKGSRKILGRVKNFFTSFGKKRVQANNKENDNFTPPIDLIKGKCYVVTFSDGAHELVKYGGPVFHKTYHTSFHMFIAQQDGRWKRGLSFPYDKSDMTDIIPYKGDGISYGCPAL